VAASYSILRRSMRHLTYQIGFSPSRHRTNGSLIMRCIMRQTTLASEKPPPTRHRGVVRVSSRSFASQPQKAREYHTDQALALQLVPAPELSPLSTVAVPRRSRAYPSSESSARSLHPVKMYIGQQRNIEGESDPRPDPEYRTFLTMQGQTA
jgi:hypothetical protein